MVPRPGKKDSRQHAGQKKTETRKNELRQGERHNPHPYTPFDFSHLVDVPLVPLSSDLENLLSGVYAQPDFDISQAQGITTYFLEDADKYHELYFQPENMRILLQNALDVTGKKYSRPFIFDVGSGSGNTVFACASLFDDCQIVATDLSPQMLAILRKIQQKTFPDVPIYCWAVDALNISIKPDSFDLFLGSAILHHLLQPQKAIQCAYNALKQGGMAFFVEPFLSGHVVALSLYQTLLRLDANYVSDKLPLSIRQALENQVAGWLHRIKQCEEANENDIKNIDDKWIFTNKMIDAMAKSAGFKETDFISIKHAKRYNDELYGVMRFYGVDHLPLPEWVNDIVSTFDESDAIQSQNDIAMCKIIIMNK